MGLEADAAALAVPVVEGVSDDGIGIVKALGDVGVVLRQSGSVVGYRLELRPSESGSRSRILELGSRDRACELGEAVCVLSDPDRRVFHVRAQWPSLRQQLTTLHRVP